MLIRRESFTRYNNANHSIELTLIILNLKIKLIVCSVIINNYIKPLDPLTAEPLFKHLFFNHCKF